VSGAGSIAIAHFRGDDVARGDGAFSIDVGVSFCTNPVCANAGCTNAHRTNTSRAPTPRSST